MSLKWAVVCGAVCVGISWLGVARVSAQSAPAAAAGMRVYVDPKSGALRDAPDASEAAMGRAAAAASTSAAGLREVAGPSAAHGVSVDLQGRFRSTMQVRIGENGATTSDCDTAPTTATAP